MTDNTKQMTREEFRKHLGIMKGNLVFAENDPEAARNARIIAPTAFFRELISCYEAQRDNRVGLRTAEELAMDYARRYYGAKDGQPCLNRTMLESLVKTFSEIVRPHILPPVEAKWVDGCLKVGLFTLIAVTHGGKPPDNWCWCLSFNGRPHKAGFADTESAAKEACLKALNEIRVSLGGQPAVAEETFSPSLIKKLERAFAQIESGDFKTYGTIQEFIESLQAASEPTPPKHLGLREK